MSLFTKAHICFQMKLCSIQIQLNIMNYLISNINLKISSVRKEKRGTIRISKYQLVNGKKVKSIHGLQTHIT